MSWGQIIDNALLESPNRVVVESPHRVKCSNGLPEAIQVRQSKLGVDPASTTGNDGSWVTCASDWTLWQWRDQLSLTSGGASLGDAGDISFFSTYLADANALALPDDWTANYQNRSINLGTPSDSTTSVNGIVGQGDYYSGGVMTAFGNYPPYLAGDALSGWAIWFDQLMIARSQVRYLGPRVKIPYWSGRVRMCVDYSTIATVWRIDVTAAGWLPVISGEAKVTVPIVSSVPFPIQVIEDTTVGSGYYFRLPLTLDANFTVLASDPSSCSLAWGLPFNVWLNNVTPFP
jgi:hypothetical protein